MKNQKVKNEQLNKSKITKADRTRSAFLMPTFEIEKQYLNKGLMRVAGVDEAGRGSLAGPLSVAMVIYPAELILSPPTEITESIKDSKLLTHKKRQELVSVVTEFSYYSDVVMINNLDIDRLNINGATEYAINLMLKKYSERYSSQPDALLIDGTFPFKYEIPYRHCKKGDEISFTIASASILAKVARDELLMKLDKEYPGYNFAGNKGYGTKEHREAIQRIGYTAIHRLSYEPVKSMAEG